VVEFVTKEISGLLWRSSPLQFEIWSTDGVLWTVLAKSIRCKQFVYKKKLYYHIFRFF